MFPRLHCWAFSLGYVSSVYIMPGGRIPANDTSVLWRRILGVTVYSAVVTANVGVDPLEWTKLDWNALVGTVKAVLSILVLYSGVLFSNGFPGWPELKTWQNKWSAAKTYLVGPITEELVYRGVFVSIYLDEGLTRKQALTENFLYFGLAHLHHALMRWLREEANGRQACTEAAVHFVITSLFGTYACFLLLQTGSVWPAVAAHLLCNYLGPPSPDGSTLYYALSAASVAGFAYTLQYI